ncbi:hypothetical protein C499_15855 [Halogeometricum borinquense DSM 11551]|uniref:Uncharacterized protein n=2 Tax=Halogeometricum borinquense TaxID=60847 RepID=E4NS23_HALBP|nr:hypothetical protein [Halogeometricum borinquense]ADQ68069.1 hypothetical protein Hbor_25150 [Halogeometricum borinquense DSM 11551]ELY24887.1 hypothetical protein C499_15855 [Halogeometricum borinquense DSM 11551]RYJ13018.1 hypothetical protein ELS19_02895 [Halogeometricum borinquense]
MNLRESAVFVADVLHIVLLGLVFVVGLTIQSTFAIGARRWDAIRSSGASSRGTPQPAPDSRSD